MATPIRSILAATDLTPNSLEALRAAAALSALTGAELHVVHVVEPALASVGESGISVLRTTQDARTALWAEIQSALPHPYQVSSAVVASERAPAAILKRAEEVGASLIVLGPHRTRAIGDRVLGTTAERLIRESPVPCLIVRGPTSFPMHRFLVPSDLSDLASGSLAAALGWAEALQGPDPAAGGAELNVVHVETPTASGQMDLRRSHERQSELLQEVAVMLERLRPSPRIRVRQEVVYGRSPADEILRAARVERTELVIMGTRGDRPLVRTLLGSVSAAVTRESEIPVLLIPPRVWESAAASAREARRRVETTTLSI